MQVWQNKTQWFKYLNHVTSQFDKQSSQHRALWSHFCWAKSIQKIAMSKFSKSTTALPPSVRENPSPPHSFCFQGEEDGQGWWDWCGQVWVDQVGVSHGSRQPSIRLQILLTLCYLQGWMPRGLDQVGDGLPWDWEPDAHYEQILTITKFVSSKFVAGMKTNRHLNTKHYCPWLDV
jgi:hypothetical protein